MLIVTKVALKTAFQFLFLFLRYFWFLSPSLPLIFFSLVFLVYLILLPFQSPLASPPMISFSLNTFTFASSRIPLPPHTNTSTQLSSSHAFFLILICPRFCFSTHLFLQALSSFSFFYLNFSWTLHFFLSLLFFVFVFCISATNHKATCLTRCV